ncbi:hypothetical protein FRB91_011729 [Serendipita sp. 411]|nr:hypothetical protein FRB91_011729 [Serendipita sp. 411]
MRKMMPSKGTTIMDSLVDLLFQYRSTQYAIVAAMTLWAYDYLITFPAEIKLVWQKRNVFWTKILFSANRNLPIVYTYFIAQLILPVPTTVASRRE